MRLRKKQQKQKRTLAEIIDAYLEASDRALRDCEGLGKRPSGVSFHEHELGIHDGCVMVELDPFTGCVYSDQEEQAHDAGVHSWCTPSSAISNMTRANAHLFTEQIRQIWLDRLDPIDRAAD